MRHLGLLLAAASAALLLTANPVLAQGKGLTPGTQSDQPTDTPNADTPNKDTPSQGTSGGRGSPAEAPTPAPQHESAPVAEHWNSAAAAIWTRRGTSHVAVGYSGVRQSAEDARESALDACRNAGGQGCKTIGAWNTGCLYITTGRNSSRVGWGSGGSVEASLKKCRSYGFTCKPPIGGCVD